MSRLFKTTLAVLALTLPALGWAQGKIAVVNPQEAIMQTVHAQKAMEDVRNQDDYKSDKAEFDKLKKELEDLVKKFQKDAAVMSQEQQVSARQKLASKEGDLQHVAGKLQKSEQAAAQTLMQTWAPKVQEVLLELISTEGIGLLLQQQAVIHADAGYNITAKVTDKLNQMSAE